LSWELLRNPVIADKPSHMFSEGVEFVRFKFHEAVIIPDVMVRCSRWTQTHAHAADVIQPEDFIHYQAGGKQRIKKQTKVLRPVTETALFQEEGGATPPERDHLISGRDIDTPRQVFLSLHL